MYAFKPYVSPDRRLWYNVRKCFCFCKKNCYNYVKTEQRSSFNVYIFPYQLVFTAGLSPPPQLYFILLTVPRYYFLFGSPCLLVLVSVSVLFSPSVCLSFRKLNDHLLEESCLIRFTVCSLCILSYCYFSYYPLWVEGGTLVLIAPVPGHGLSFTFQKIKNKNILF